MMHNYDQTNRLIESKQKPYTSSTWLISKYTYDIYGRILREINPMGLYIDKIYNDKGEMVSTVDHKGLKTTYEYDSWSRSIKTSYPDGAVESQKIGWAPDTGSSGSSSGTTDIHTLNLSTPRTQGGIITACESILLTGTFSYNSSQTNEDLVLRIDPTQHVASPPRYECGGTAIYLTTTIRTGVAAEQKYYDVFGRELRTGQMQFDGNFLYTDYQYDDKGRLSKTSQPFRGTSATKWSTITYDEYDRILTVTEASGKKSTYSYGKNLTTSVIDGVSTTKHTNVLGQTIKVTNPSSLGTISHSYRADGQLNYTYVHGLPLNSNMISTEDK